MKDSHLQRASMLGALGGILFADPVLAQSQRGSFAHKHGQKSDRDSQADYRDNKREIIDFVNRGDIRPLPVPLKQRPVRLAKRPQPICR